MSSTATANRAGTAHESAFVADTSPRRDHVEAQATSGHGPLNIGSKVARLVSATKPAWPGRSAYTLMMVQVLDRKHARG